MKNKRKKGSSLVMIIVFIGIISILGLAISSLAVNSYKVRSVSTLSKANFYITESGIDKVYAIIGKVVDNAMVTGNQAVEDAMNALDLQYEKVVELNKEPSTDGSLFIKDDGTIDEEYIRKYQNTTFQSAYKSLIEDTLKDEINNASYSFPNYSTPPIITILSPTSTEDVEFINNKVSITIESSFKHKDIEKIIDVKYEINVPEYNSVYYLDSNVIKLRKNTAWTKTISVDGDVVSTAKDVTINGDVFVKGRGNGGIILDKTIDGTSLSPKLTVKGEVLSSESLLLNANNSHFVVSGNTYVKNSILDDEAEKATLEIEGNLYTGDDLELNGKKSVIVIGGSYYGVSEGSGSPYADRSSSIVINSEDIGAGSSITIDGDVMIAGSAYITLNKDDLGNDVKYQTGESIAIKGNYKAYTSPLNKEGYDGEYKEENMIFEYLDPLTLVTGKKDTINFFIREKSKYFNEYNTLYPNELSLGGSGINIGGTVLWNTGAIIKGGTIESTFISSDPTVLESKELELKKKIYYMGENTSEEDVIIKSRTEPQVYLKNKRVNFNAIDSMDNTIGVDSDGKKYFNNTKEAILLNKDENKKYVLVGPNGEDGSAYADSSNNMIKITSTDGKFKGIIVTAGDLYICGDINFTGTIICGGNLVFVDSRSKTLTYNESFISKLIAYNRDLFINESKEEVFIAYDGADELDIEVQSDLGVDENVKTDIIRDKLIRRVHWELKK